MTRWKHVQNASNLRKSIYTWFCTSQAVSKKKKFELLIIFIFIWIFFLLAIYEQEAFLSSYSEVWRCYK